MDGPFYFDTREPHMRFARVDLPTLGRPTMAMRGRVLVAAGFMGETGLTGYTRGAAELYT